MSAHRSGIYIASERENGKESRAVEKRSCQNANEHLSPPFALYLRRPPNRNTRRFPTTLTDISFLFNPLSLSFASSRDSFFLHVPRMILGIGPTVLPPKQPKKKTFSPLLLLFIFIVYYYYYRVGYGLQYRKLFVAHKLLYREYRALPEKVDAAGLPYH